ncbi:hypothetical protein [Butyrivibrio sp. WCE2006]|uniref:hypothetical protein n=1 Tax=Butyrivibrio sp. WCE2006 TaxID=1410611 RepID=UPI0005D14A16|nr:hypothetical protein [Butyrivibrio sp. WCE2006]
MNIEAARKSGRMAVTIVFAGVLSLYILVMTTTTVHAQNCMHDEYEWVSVIKPTCSRFGKDIRLCQDCEEILETEIIPKLDHKCKWERTKEPTCTLPGVKSYICKNCSEVIETEEIPAKGHRFARAKTQSATCRSPKITERTCSVCGFSTSEQSGGRIEHRYKWKVTRAATCADCGIKTGTCTMCNVTKTESIPPTGKHKYGDWSVKSVKVKGKKLKVVQERSCKTCGRNTREASGTTASFSGKHDNGKYYYKHTKKTGRIVILCSECRQSVSGKISGGTIKFTRPKKNNSKVSSKGWRRVYIMCACFLDNMSYGLT